MLKVYWGGVPARCTRPTWHWTWPARRWPAWHWTWLARRRLARRRPARRRPARRPRCTRRPLYRDDGLLKAERHAERMRQRLWHRAKHKPYRQQQRTEIFADHLDVRRRHSVDTLRTPRGLQAFRAQGWRSTRR